MTRTIKFRAWDENLKRMFFVKSHDWKNKVCWAWNPDGHSIIDPILMQFTGLLDRNGVEIWESDIVRCFSKDGTKVYDHEVKLPDFFREIWSENEYNLPADEGQRTKVEVVGNKYLNPELLS